MDAIRDRIRHYFQQPHQQQQQQQQNQGRRRRAQSTPADQSPPGSQTSPRQHRPSNAVPLSGSSNRPPHQMPQSSNEGNPRRPLSTGDGVDLMQAYAAAYADMDADPMMLLEHALPPAYSVAPASAHPGQRGAAVGGEQQRHRPPRATENAEEDSDEEDAGNQPAPAQNPPVPSAQQQQREPQPETRFRVDEAVQIRLLPYNPYFPTIEKELRNGMTVPIGRYQRHGHRDDPLNEGIYFRSTVVSRRHAEISFLNGEFFIRDVKSLGGTFLNSTRLSQAGQESRLYKLYHGDILQFGVDYRPDSRTGQVRNKDKCVELRLEFPKLMVDKPKEKPERWIPAQHQYTECCICLSRLYKKQALFIAPCTHSFHYRCIAPLLRGNSFQCPMCRQTGDLHASVYSLDTDEEDEVDAVAASPQAAVQSSTDPRPEENGQEETPLPLFSDTIQQPAVSLAAAAPQRSAVPQQSPPRQATSQQAQPSLRRPSLSSPQQQQQQQQSSKQSSTRQQQSPVSPLEIQPNVYHDDDARSPLSPSTKVNSAKDSEFPAPVNFTEQPHEPTRRLPNSEQEPVGGSSSNNNRGVRALTANRNQGQLVSIDGSVDAVDQPGLPPRHDSAKLPANPKTLKTDGSSPETGLNLSELALALLAESPKIKGKRSHSRNHPPAADQLDPNLQTMRKSSRPTDIPVSSTPPTGALITPGSPPLAQRQSPLQPVLSPISHQTRLKENYADPQLLVVPANSANELASSMMALRAVADAQLSSSPLSVSTSGGGNDSRLQPTQPSSPLRQSTRVRTTQESSSSVNGTDPSNESLPASTAGGTQSGSTQSVGTGTGTAGGTQNGSTNSVEAGTAGASIEAQAATVMIPDSANIYAPSTEVTSNLAPPIANPMNGSSDTRIESSRSDWQLQF